MDLTKGTGDEGTDVPGPPLTGDTECTPSLAERAWESVREVVADVLESVVEGVLTNLIPW